MLCKNCNYILTGKENYCPNCASPLTEKASQTLKNQDGQQEKERQNEQTARREFIFPEREEKGYEAMKNTRIFYEPPENEYENREKKKSYGGRIMLMLFLTCAFVAGAFAVADYFDITPSVFRFLSQGTTDGQVTSSADFSHESSIIKPDITYTPERAYIMSGEGMSLRKGPGKGYAPVESLSDLTAVIIYGGSLAYEGWVYVYCEEKECYGWLDGSFLARDTKEETTLFAENYITEESTESESSTASE